MKKNAAKIAISFIIFLIVSITTGVNGTAIIHASPPSSDEYILTVIEDEETALAAGVPEIRYTFFPYAVAAIVSVILLALILGYLMECNKYRTRIRSLASEMEHMPRSGLTIKESRSFRLDKLIRTVRQLEEDRVEDIMNK